MTVLGTGIMGTAMARTLLRAGFSVTVWNRSADRAEPLARDGATVATDPREAVDGADVVTTMLFDDDAVADTLEPLLDTMAGRAVWVQTSTVGVDGAQRLARLAADHGVDHLDTPVLGTREPAEDGELVLLPSGDQGLRERVQPVFDALGDRTVWVSQTPGDGSRLKLAANSWLATVVVGVAQSVALTRDLGLDPQLFLDAIAGHALDSPYAQLKGAGMVEGDFTPSFALHSVAKDVGLVLDAARASGTDTTLLRALDARFRAAMDAGHGDDDAAAVITAW